MVTVSRHFESGGITPASTGIETPLAYGDISPASTGIETPRTDGHPKLEALRRQYLGKLRRVRQIAAQPACQSVAHLAELLALELRRAYDRDTRALADRIRGGRKPTVTDAELRRMVASLPQRAGWTRGRWVMELQRMSPALAVLDPGWLARRVAKATTATLRSERHAVTMGANTLADMADNELEARVRELRRELEPLEAEQLARAWCRGSVVTEDEADD